MRRPESGSYGGIHGCVLLGREDYSFVRDGNMATLYDAQAREVAATQASKAGMSAKKMQEEYEEN